MDKKEILEKLSFDPSKYTALELIKFAREGKYVNVLSRYDSVTIRMTLARHGHGLDILMNDDNAGVRYHVACHISHAKFLLNDEDPQVSGTAHVTIFNNFNE